MFRRRHQHPEVPGAALLPLRHQVYAPFAATITEVLMAEAGAVIRKSQPLFRVEPDGKLVIEDPGERAARVRACIDEYLASVL